jgi:DNA-binding response OmpR family regulator
VTGPILVVEDDESMTDAIVRNLTARGYEVHCAADVSEAIALLRIIQPAMVLLDIDLPDGSGWEVLRELRSQGVDDVPVIVITALRPNPSLVKELQCSAVLEKPFPMESLMRLVTTGGAP